MRTGFANMGFANQVYVQLRNSFTYTTVVFCDAGMGPTGLLLPNHFRVALKMDRWMPFLDVSCTSYQSQRQDVILHTLHVRKHTTHSVCHKSYYNSDYQCQTSYYTLHVRHHTTLNIRTSYYTLCIISNTTLHTVSVRHNTTVSKSGHHTTLCMSESIIHSVCQKSYYILTQTSYYILHVRHHITF